MTVGGFIVLYMGVNAWAIHDHLMPAETGGFGGGTSDKLTRRSLPMVMQESFWKKVVSDLRDISLGLSSNLAFS